MNKFWKKKRGFTLIELLVVIGLLCILVLIAIPHFSSVRTRACNAAAKSALKNAYNAAQAFYTDSPAGTITTTILENYGYAADPNVNLNLVDGSPGSLSITAAYNQPGAQTYSIDFIGSISP